jgi:hypothetical protein
MSGRRLCTDAEAEARGFWGEEASRRRIVLRETIQAFERADPPDLFHRLADENLERWHTRSGSLDGSLRIEVLPGDWGAVAHRMTKEHGVRFAVLNMANAYVPGGAYVEGAVAQEENMFRRTDCHMSVEQSEYDEDLDRYMPTMTSLLSADHGSVYLDTNGARVCIRGPEDRGRADLGYEWLARDEIFSFFELRAAAPDLRDGSPFDPAEASKRIAAQLDTLRNAGVRAAVLGAFGCGAFQNPGAQVAEIYRREILARRDDFAVIAFAVFDAGYGPNNYELFREVLVHQ